MTARKHVRIDGTRYVLVPHEEYLRLVRRASGGNPPALPRADAEGNVPAVQFARASIAREVHRRRAALGLTQGELARRAGLRLETICRIETGKHTASTASIAKLDRALNRAERGGRSRGR